jgi:hypothetical protein
MKKLIICLLFFNLTHAIKGVVKVLEAPIYLEEDENSVVLEKYRKGSVIFINDNSLNNKFYKTISQSGNDAYIRRDYIKVIYKDLRELEQNITMKEDPTDYILEEPLPSSYPFSSRKKNKAAASLSFNHGNSTYYDYTSPIHREQINPAAALELKYTRRASFDVENRLYYGFQIGARTSRNEFQLDNKVFTEETQSVFQGGPLVTYTVYRRKTFEIDSTIHFSFNYHRNMVSQEFTQSNEFEEKLFSGFSTSAVITTMFVHKDMGKNNDFDFVHGPSMEYSPGYSLSTSTPSVFKNAWDSNTIKFPMKISISYSLGVMYRF